jgi:hypothetical protein
MFQLYSQEGGELESQHEFARREADKRVTHLMKKTGHRGADPEHLTDSQFCDLMLGHEEGMAKQLKLMLVDKSPPGFGSVAAAGRALTRVKREVLSHVHEQSSSLMKVTKYEEQVRKNVRSHSPSGAAPARGRPRVTGCLCGMLCVLHPEQGCVCMCERAGRPALYTGWPGAPQQLPEQDEQRDGQAPQRDGRCATQPLARGCTAQQLA